MPSRRCSCGETMPIRVVPRGLVLDRPTVVAMCPLCDARQCEKCKTYVPQPKAGSCPNCGQDLRLGRR